MKEIKIKEMIISNFKGIKSLKLDFKNKQTNIYGANGTGKTSIADAFFWVLFDKDSSNRKDFLIRPQDQDGNEIIEPLISVELELEIDGRLLKVKKEQKKKIKGKRGLEQKVEGNETIYTFDEVPTTMANYKKQIAELIDEETFKLITNPLYFNQSVDWKKKREILVKISGTELSDEDILAANEEFKELLESKGSHNIDDYKKILNDNKKKIKERVESIPIRIDELLKQTPENLNEEEIKAIIAAKEKEIEEIDKTITDVSKQLEPLKQLKEQEINLDMGIKRVEQEIETMRNELNTNDELESKIKLTESQVKNNKDNIERIKKQISNYEELIKLKSDEREKLLAEFNGIKAQEFVFDENGFVCPITKQPCNSVAESEKERLEKEFEEKKANELNVINAKGKVIRTELDSATTSLENSKRELEEVRRTSKLVEEKLEELQKQFNKSEVLEDTPEINQKIQEVQDIKDKLEIVKTDISNFVMPDTTEEKQKRNEITLEIDEQKKLLMQIENSVKNQERIEELRKEQLELQAQVDQIEKLLADIEKFTKSKVTILENSINNKFKLVKFKLFNTLENGSIEECCIATVNGVEYADVNTANKINAGLDIINTLCEFYEVQAPIIIDNRESIIKLIDTKSQIVNLIVSEADAELRVE